MDIPVNSEQLLLERQNLNKHRVDKNRLLLISIVNIITFLCAIFSMVYYRWIHISFQFGQRQQNRKSQMVSMWVNLLYASNDQQRQYYLSYTTVQEQICQNDTFCLAIFYELDFVGKLCSGIFFFAFLISTYDVVRIIKFAIGDLVTRSKFFNQGNSAINFKNNFRSFLMIITYTIGLTLNYFAMTLIQLQDYRYGISFWLFFCSLIVFGLASIWQNRKLSKISRQQLIIRLIQNQKAMLRASKQSDDQSKSQILVI